MAQSGMQQFDIGALMLGQGGTAMVALGAAMGGMAVSTPPAPVPVPKMSPAAPKVVPSTPPASSNGGGAASVSASKATALATLAQLRSLSSAKWSEAISSVQMAFEGLSRELQARQVGSYGPHPLALRIVL